jgi:uncharacterized protein YcbK (DUF882 family)
MPADRALRLSKHYVLGDLLIDSTFPDLATLLDPSAQAVENMKRLTALIDRIADQFPPKWKVLSGYRDERLNEACRKAGLPASIDSLHLFGCAADIQPVDEELILEDVYEWISQHSHSGDLPVHEAVYYPNKGFIHVGVESSEQKTQKRIIMRT